MPRANETQKASDLRNRASAGEPLRSSVALRPASRISIQHQFHAPNLQPVPLMDMGFAIIRPLARRRMPQIRFLYIGSHVCSTLLSDAPSRLRPCVSLSLHLHQVVKGTSTPKLSNM